VIISCRLWMMSAPTGGIALTGVCMHNTQQIFTKISLGNATLPVEDVTLPLLTMDESIPRTLSSRRILINISYQPCFSNRFYL